MTVNYSKKFGSKCSKINGQFKKLNNLELRDLYVCYVILLWKRYQELRRAHHVAQLASIRTV